jgi:hypothetical protein
MRNVNEARAAFEDEIKKVFKSAGIPTHHIYPLTERFIDLVTAIRWELRKTDGR